MAAVVIADASPMIALARVDGLGWLPALFSSVLVSETVLREVLTGRFPESETPIAASLEAGWLRVATSIRLALASGPPVLLLIDERAGRAVARELGLTLAGTAAVIGLARQRGLIPSAKDVFALLTPAISALLPMAFRRFWSGVGSEDVDAWAKPLTLGIMT